MSASPESPKPPENTDLPESLASPEATERPESAASLGAHRSSGSATSFSANLKKLPGISHLAALDLFDTAGNAVARIENKPGSQGSLAIYNHLAQTYGAITPEAARKGLELFAEHAIVARTHPGKHPNIDRLHALIEERKTLRIKHVFAF